MTITKDQATLVDSIYVEELLENENFCDITIRFLMALRHKLYQMPLSEKTRTDRELYEVLNEFQRQVGTDRVSVAFLRGKHGPEGSK